MPAGSHKRSEIQAKIEWAISSVVLHRQARLLPELILTSVKFLVFNTKEGMKRHLVRIADHGDAIFLLPI